MRATDVTLSNALNEKWYQISKLTQNRIESLRQESIFWIVQLKLHFQSHKLKTTNAQPTVPKSMYLREVLISFYQ